MPKNYSTIFASRFIPGSERRANQLITESGRQLLVLTHQGEPLRRGANYLVETPGISERARVTGCQTLRVLCRLVCLSSNGRSRSDHYSWRLDDEAVLGNERPRFLRSVYLSNLTKQDARKAMRQHVLSFRPPPPAGDRFLVFPGPIQRRGNAGPTPVMVRRAPAPAKLPTPHKLCPHQL